MVKLFIEYDSNREEYWFSEAHADSLTAFEIPTSHADELEHARHLWDWAQGYMRRVKVARDGG